MTGFWQKWINGFLGSYFIVEDFKREGRLSGQ
jgi:hypothetical protein